VVLHPSWQDRQHLAVNISQSELKSILGDGDVSVTFSLGSSAGIGDIQSTANIVATKVYTIDGKALAGHDSTDTLPKGSYIVKTTYNDGTTTTRKITL